MSILHSTDIHGNSLRILCVCVCAEWSQVWSLRLILSVVTVMCSSTRALWWTSRSCRPSRWQTHTSNHAHSNTSHAKHVDKRMHVWFKMSSLCQGLFNVVCKGPPCVIWKRSRNIACNVNTCFLCAISYLHFEVPLNYESARSLYNYSHFHWP